MDQHSTLGARSQVIGVIGRHATVGSDVDANGGLVRWMIVGPHATVGSGTRISGLRSWDRSVEVHAGARVPPNTVITEEYCLQHPRVCLVD